MSKKKVRCCPRCHEAQHALLNDGELCGACIMETRSTWKSGARSASERSGRVKYGRIRR